jgi:hypothetical protein
MILAIIGAVCLIVAAIIGRDMLRFRKAQKLAESPKALGTDAGGYLYIMGGRTYYKMPKGAARKVADYAMDLRPGSPDMTRFKRILNNAAEEHAAEVAAMKAKADANMHDIAKEAAK